MSMRRAPGSFRRRGRRSFRRKNPAPGIAAALVLAALLAAAGIWYTGVYQRHIDYAQYPLRYEALIRENAERFALEPWHVAAVVRCESSFDASAVSKVGAMGLMQIMPDTGEWLAGKFDEENGFGAEMLFEPETNLKYGCWFLQWLMNRYEGDRTLATAAFHAGHGTVDKWLEDPAVSPDGKTLESIPYDSTRIYVGRVLKACEKYQELYDFAEPGGDSD